MDENGTGTTVNQFAPVDTFAGLTAADALIDAPVRAIHRGPSGYISFAVKSQGHQWRELGALAVGQPLLPGLLAQLAADGYFSLNTAHRTGTRTVETRREVWRPIPGEPPGEQLVNVPRVTVTRLNAETGLPHAHYRNDALRWLNVAYVDLDCYKLGLSVGDTLGALVNLQDAGTLPPATMFARSGRGLWALWLLLDERNPATGTADVFGEPHTPDTPQRATRHALALYARVQAALVKRLRHLGADLSAVNAARYAPMPGTMKTTGSDRVRYWVQGAPSPPFYTLPHLAAALGVTRDAHPVIRAALDGHEKNPKRQAAGRKGWRVRWQNTLRDLDLLRDLRADWRGHRHWFALFYAVALYRSGVPKGDTTARVLAFADAVGLPVEDGQAACKQAFRQYPYSHLSRAAMLDALGATAAERSYLDANRPPEPAPTAGPRSLQGRHKAIRDAIAGLGYVPSVRVLAGLLAAQGVPCGNHSTVWRDYRAMGLRPAAKPGRPPKLPLSPD